MTPFDERLIIGPRLRTFIDDELVPGGGGTFTDETPLLTGFIDSAGLMQLIMFIEDEFDLQIDESEITPDHFQTVSDIERFVKTKMDSR